MPEYWFDRPGPDIPATWRRGLIPPCPSCRRGAGNAQHRDCANKQADRAGEADLYIDISTGHLHCIACGYESPLDGWKNWCSCGAVYEGGEIWQGMATESGSVGGLAWFQAAGLRRGTPEITFLGWSFCRACQKSFDKSSGFIQTGTRKGGMCQPCHDQAQKWLGAWMTLRSVKKPCSWCGGLKDRGRIVAIGKGRLCQECSDLMTRQQLERYLETVVSGPGQR